jgi:protoporphyrinogen oxidase
MTLAHRLQSARTAVTLLEAGPAIGGLAAPQTLGGFTWDRFYHVILMSDARLRALLRELELEDLLNWQTTRTGFFIDDRLHSLSDVMDFLAFRPLSATGKLRLAATILYASRVKDWRRLESIPVADWLIRLSGRRTFARVWLPLLKSKLGENYRSTSAAFIWATIARMYAARRSGLKREMFGYVEGGYNTILTRFRERLNARGVETLCDHAVTEVHDSGSQTSVRFRNHERLEFDTVILTIPCGRIAAVCPQLTTAERARLEQVVYQGIICGSMLLRQPLAEYYITNITEPWVPFTAVIEMTALVDRRTFGGLSLVYLPRYLTQGDRTWEATDDAVWESNFDALERMYPTFRREQVVARQMSRVREMLAISTLEYSSRVLPPLRTSLPNVFVINSAQIANGTLNVDETVALANRQAAALAPQLLSPVAGAAR